MIFRDFFKTSLFLLSIAAFLALGITGCGSKSSRSKITVYISGPTPMLQKLEKTFEKDHGDVIDLVSMGCGPLRQRVWTEMEAGQIKADVFWGSDPLIYEALEKRGALVKYTPKGAEKIKPSMKLSDYYTCINKRLGVIIYNDKKFKEKEVPSSFKALLNKSLNGRLVQSDPAQSSTALALVAGLWNVTGKNGAFYRGLKANNLFLAKKNNEVPAKIEEGEFDAGIAPHDAVYRLRKKAKKEGYPTSLSIAWPAEGALEILRPIAISKNKNRSEKKSQIARDFVDFMVSKTAQKITTGFGFVSVRKDIPLPKGFPHNLKERRVNWKKLSKQQREIRDSFKKIFN